MSHIANDALRKDGYAFLHDFMPDASSFHAFAQIGKIDKVEGMCEIQTLTPKIISESLPNTYSGNFGTTDFPLHSDLAHWSSPPRFLTLRCIKGSIEVPTRVLPSHELISIIGENLLRRTLAQPRRPLNNRNHVLQLLEKPTSSEHPLLRWDGIYLLPYNSLSIRVFETVKRTIQDLRPIEFFLTKPGETLIIDNWRCLHGRSNTPPSAQDRKIDRAYFSEIYEL